MNKIQIKQAIREAKTIFVADNQQNANIDAFIDKIIESDLKIVAVEAGFQGEHNWAEVKYSRAVLVFKVTKKKPSKTPIRDHNTSVSVGYRFGELMTIIGEFENVSVILNEDRDAKLNFMIAHLEDYLAEDYFYRNSEQHSSGGTGFNAQSLYACLLNHFENKKIKDLSNKAKIITRHESGAKSFRDDHYIALQENDQGKLEFSFGELNSHQKIIVDYLSNLYLIKQKQLVA